MAFDPSGNRLVLFGGWANKWLGDMHYLDIGSVVGPPYAIMGLKPSIGAGENYTLVLSFVLYLRTISSPVLYNVHSV